MIQIHDGIEINPGPGRFGSAVRVLVGAPTDRSRFRSCSRTRTSAAGSLPSPSSGSYWRQAIDVSLSSLSLPSFHCLKVNGKKISSGEVLKKDTKEVNPEILYSVFDEPVDLGTFSLGEDRQSLAPCTEMLSFLGLGPEAHRRTQITVRSWNCWNWQIQIE